MGRIGRERDGPIPRNPASKAQGIDRMSDFSSESCSELEPSDGMARKFLKLIELGLGSNSESIFS